MNTISTILESRDFITAALKIIGLLALAGFWLLYFVRYHRTARELRRLEAQRDGLLDECFGLQTRIDMLTPTARSVGTITPRASICPTCGAVGVEHRA